MSKDSLRAALGVLAGVGWGLVLGYFFKSGNMAGPWLAVFFGPPVVLLISPKTPILSWQTPLVTASVFGAILTRSRGDTGSGGPPDTAGSVLLGAVLLWIFLSAVSCPWFFIFQKRSKKEGVAPSATAEGTNALRIVSVLAVFVVCGLILIGFATTIYLAEASGPGESSGRWYGLLIAAGGVVLSVVIYRFSNKQGIGGRVKEVLELPMILGGAFGALFALAPLIFALWDKTERPSSAGEIFPLLAALEAAAGLLWLRKTEKDLQREQDSERAKLQIEG